MGTSAAGELIANDLVEVVSVGGGVFLYVAGHARLSLPAAGGGLLLLIVVDLLSLGLSSGGLAAGQGRLYGGPM